MIKHNIFDKNISWDLIIDNNNWVYWIFDSSNFYFLSSSFFDAKLSKDESDDRK